MVGADRDGFAGVTVEEPSGAINLPLLFRGRRGDAGFSASGPRVASRRPAASSPLANHGYLKREDREDISSAVFEDGVS